MRFLVVITACLSIASALPQQSFNSAFNPGQQDVSIVPLPTVYQDSVVDGLAGAAGPRFGASNAFGAANAEANAFSGAGSLGVGGFGGPSAISGANAYARSFSGAGSLGVGGFGGPSAISGANADARSFSGAGTTGFGGSGAVPNTYNGDFSQATATATGTGSSVFTSAKTKVITKPAEITKNFYYHVAKDDGDVNTQAGTLTITPKKHYKVIFIKAPSASASSGSQSYAASKTEEKTLVYVLVGKPGDSTAVSDASASSFVSGKPEVYFVKYQGPQAAAAAKSNSNAGAGGAIAIADANANAGFGGANANANANANAGFGGANANAGARANGGFGGANANAGARANSGFGGGFGNAAGYANAGADSFGVGANPTYNQGVGVDGIAY